MYRELTMNTNYVVHVCTDIVMYETTACESVCMCYILYNGVLPFDRET